MQEKCHGLSNDWYDSSIDTRVQEATTLFIFIKYHKTFLLQTLMTTTVPYTVYPRGKKEGKRMVERRRPIPMTVPCIMCPRGGRKRRRRGAGTKGEVSVAGHTAGEGSGGHRVHRRRLG